jgi:hypothetical protein
MFVLNSNITIGSFKNVKPHQVKIEKSIFQYADKAIITIPISSRITRAGEVITASVETAKVIEEGMPVTIQLGYNGFLKTEFNGFVSRVNFSTPCQIECEGYSYLLRKKTYGPKVFKRAKLIDVLKYLIATTAIVLDEKSIPDFEIEKLIIDNHNGCEVLEKIKKISDNTIRIYFTGNILYAGLVALKIKKNVKYRLAWNVIKDNNLKLRQAKNQDVIVKYISEQNTGNKITVQSGNHSKKVNEKKVNTASSGSTGETKVIKTQSVTNEASLQQMSDAKLQQLKYNGYEGKITTFLQPFCEPADKAIIEDAKYPDRNGNYLIESTEVNYGMSGARRIVAIGLKL